MYTVNIFEMILMNIIFVSLADNMLNQSLGEVWFPGFRRMKVKSSHNSFWQAHDLICNWNKTFRVLALDIC